MESENNNIFDRNGKFRIVGIVKNDSFISSYTPTGALLTTVHMQEARSRESGKIDLTQFEGKSLLIKCQSTDGDWIEGTEIVDVGGPSLTLVVNKRIEEAKQKNKRKGNTYIVGADFIINFDNS